MTVCMNPESPTLAARISGYAGHSAGGCLLHPLAFSLTGPTSCSSEAIQKAREAGFVGCRPPFSVLPARAADADTRGWNRTTRE